MSKSCVKKGDTVKIIAGKEKGKSGKVIRVNPKESLVVVEKLNMVKRHSKPSASNRQGGIVEKETPIHWSNVVRTQEASAK
jgi:large subunit ribosomal protein L24